MDLRKGKPKWRGGPDPVKVNRPLQRLSKQIRSIQFQIEQIEKSTKQDQKQNSDILIDLYRKRRELQDIYFKSL